MPFVLTLNHSAKIKYDKQNHLNLRMEQIKRTHMLALTMNGLGALHAKNVHNLMNAHRIQKIAPNRARSLPTMPILWAFGYSFSEKAGAILNEK